EAVPSHPKGLAHVARHHSRQAMWNNAKHRTSCTSAFAQLTSKAGSDRVMLNARLHPLPFKGRQLYSVIFRGKLLVQRSGDPECDAARALLVLGITGKFHLSDAGGFSVTKKRELWGMRYIYTPRLQCREPSSTLRRLRDFAP